jgi:eukaryotic-like serine/threonine-protein kinase
VITGDRVLSGRYIVEDELGRGGMARVYRGTDHVLGRAVAIKVLQERSAGDDSFVARFRREARAAAALNHHGVVAVFDSGSDGDRHYIVMELVDGRTLARVVREEGLLPPIQAADVAARVAEALGAAHAQGMVHRDVKPGNVMLTADGDVKVMDFGIARVASAHTLTSAATVLGTAAYLSPEQAQGGALDGRSDLYSLGVVLFEMLTGAVPFSGDTPVVVAYRHVQEQPPRPTSIQPDVPRSLEAIVMKAMAKDREDRYRTGAEMAADLRRFLGSEAGSMPSKPGPARTEPLPAAPTAEPMTVPGPGRRRAQATRPRRWIPVLVAVAVLALAAGLAVPRLLDAGSGPTASTGRPSQPAQARDRGPTPATSATPGASASPSPVFTGPSTVDASLSALAAAVDDGVSSGKMDDHAARDIQHDVDKATTEYERGDLEKALGQLADAKAGIGRMLDRGEITSSQRAATISGAVDDLAAAMEANPLLQSDHGGGEGHGDGGGDGSGNGN